MDFKDLGMAFKRPILLGGLGLSATLWLLETVHISLFDSSTWLSAMALGTGLWWWRSRDRAPAPARPIAPPVVDRARVEAQLARLQGLIATLAAEAAPLQEPSPGPAALMETSYEQQRQRLLADLDRQELRIAVVGDRRTGKTTLIEVLRGEVAANPLAVPLSFQEITLAPDRPDQPEWLSHEALLWVTDSDLTDSALTLLRQAVVAGQGVVLALNKADHYSPADQQRVLTQIQQRLAALPAAVAGVPVSAAPRPLKVRRHQADGTVEETWETQEPAIAPLVTCLGDTLVPQAATLVAANTLRQAEVLHQQVQSDLNRVRRQRAMPLIDQLQWVAAAAAFANPVPTLDVLATVAINGQLIMDLGKIYGFTLSLEEAKTAAGTLASLSVKLGLVELATQALTAVLKSHFATYLAGGLVQGLSAAYLTRMAGLSLIDYFEAAALADTPTHALSWEAIAQQLQAAIQQNRQFSLLQTLVQQGINILKPAVSPSPLPELASPALPLATVDPEPVTVDTNSIPA
ncbi:MAG TPA: DUF697 domain-containing protein [Leptolyngbyaceae cyanobacterium M65_K2018_010]|nr:DUF697 domain-containing protein [Leptolyngbyaceae cyanobacterium M65_K2018_010]